MVSGSSLNICRMVSVGGTCYNHFKVRFVQSQLFVNIKTNDRQKGHTKKTGIEADPGYVLTLFVLMSELIL